jgi:hypothetical protein
MTIGDFIIGTDEIGVEEVVIIPSTLAFQYYRLGSYDLRGHVIVPIDIKGQERSLKESNSPGSIKARLADQGVKALEYNFNVIFSTLAEADAFRKLVNPLSGNLVFYPGTPDWYQDTICILCREKEKSEDQLHYLLAVGLKCEDPCLKATVSQFVQSDNTPLPYTKHFSNATGNFTAPIDKIGIQGHYSSGVFTTEIIAQLLSSIEVMGEIYLTDKLLMNEWANFYTDGMMESVFLDDFANAQSIFINAIAYSNIVVGSGHVIISANGYITYLFKGPNQTRENILLQAILSHTGSPIIQTSDDGTIWNTAVDTVDLKTYYANYYLNESDKRGDVYVRFYCPAASTLDIDFMRFKAIRDCVIDGHFEIAAGTEADILISDGATSNHIANIISEFSPRRLP